MLQPQSFLQQFFTLLFFFFLKDAVVFYSMIVPLHHLICLRSSFQSFTLASLVDAANLLLLTKYRQPFPSISLFFQQVCLSDIVELFLLAEYHQPFPVVPLFFELACLVDVAKLFSLSKFRQPLPLLFKAACLQDVAELFLLTKFHRLFPLVFLLFEQTCLADAEDFFQLILRRFPMFLSLSHSFFFILLPFCRADVQELVSGI